MRLLILFSVLALAAPQARAQVDDALARPVLAQGQTRVDTQAWLASKVPPLTVPASPGAWTSSADDLRRRVLGEVIYRGAAREWRTQTPKVEYVEDLRGDGYIVRKFTFEVVPGLHAPALLYAPTPAPARPTPVIVNVNGH